MTYDTRAKSTADRLLVKFGQSVTLTHIATAAYDPATGSAATTPTAETGRAVEMEYAQRDIDGTKILRGDKKLMLPAVGITAPAVGDTVTVGAVVYTIQDVRPLAPAGLAIMYEVQARK